MQAVLNHPAVKVFMTHGGTMDWATFGARLCSFFGESVALFKHVMCEGETDRTPTIRFFFSHFVLITTIAPFSRGVWGAGANSMMEMIYAAKAEDPGSSVVALCVPKVLFAVRVPCVCAVCVPCVFTVCVTCVFTVCVCLLCVLRRCRSWLAWALSHMYVLPCAHVRVFAAAIRAIS